MIQAAVRTEDGWASVTPDWTWVIPGQDVLAELDELIDAFLPHAIWEFA